MKRDTATAGRSVDDLQDAYDTVSVHSESMSVPREMYVDCMNAADRGELGGVRVLVRHGDEFLLVQRADDDAWDAVGGSLMREETYETAAVRHVADQVGLECTLGDPFAAIEREFTLVDGGDGVVGNWVFFEADAFDADLDLAADVERAKWFRHSPESVAPDLSPHLGAVALDD